MSNCWGEGPCIQIGDFYGLDDIATEKPVVYNGWADVYGQWIKDYGISGFRVDTARHVDDNFFKNWSPQINAAAKSVGINNFTIFGEVWDVNPINLMNYVRRNKIQTVLDFLSSELPLNLPQVILMQLLWKTSLLMMISTQLPHQMPVTW